MLFSGFKWNKGHYTSNPEDSYITPFLYSIREIAQSYQDMEQELAHAVNASSKSMDQVYAKSKSAEVLPGFLVLMYLMGGLSDWQILLKAGL